MILPPQYTWLEPVLIASLVVFVIDLIGNSITFSNRYANALISAIVFGCRFRKSYLFRPWQRLDVLENADKHLGARAKIEFRVMPICGRDPVDRIAIRRISWRSLMSDSTRVDISARNSIMKLLTDEENARVATAEAGSNLAEGAEFLDLDHLEMGIQRSVSGAAVAMGHVIPRSAVGNDTWSRIVTQLSS